jgi:hypothetical protein
LHHGKRSRPKASTNLPAGHEVGLEDFCAFSKQRLAAAKMGWPGSKDTPHLDHDPIKLNRIMVWMFHWSMIFSENRFRLFGIML